MIKRVLLADIEQDRSVVTNSTLNNAWSHFPIGLMYLASSIRKSFPNIEVQLFHTITKDNAKEEMARVIETLRPDLIGLRGISRFQQLFEEFALLIRSKTGRPLISGGPFPSTSYRYVLEKNFSDLVVIGEGEAAIVEIIQAVNAEGKLPKHVPGTAVRKNGKVFVNRDRSFVVDVNQIPFPAYDLLTPDDYAGLQNHAFQETRKAAYIFCSRGCPYKCIYCHQLFGKKMRRRTAENIVTEMKEIFDKSGLDTFVILDDCFNVPLGNAKEILRRIARELPNVKINFPNGLRVDMIDEEFVSLLEACHCVEIALAVETASPRLQKYIGKRLNLKKAEKNVDIVSRKFITTVFFMVGFPTETYEDALQTIDFARQMEYISQPVLSVVRVYEHTPLYDLLDCRNNELFRANRQDKMDMHTQLNNQMQFYGDYFDSDAVPLKSENIADLRLKWNFDVVFNEKRLANCNRILAKYLSEDQLLNFYRCFLDRKDLNKEGLRRKILGRSSSGTGSRE